MNKKYFVILFCVMCVTAYSSDGLNDSEEKTPQLSTATAAAHVAQQHEAHRLSASEERPRNSERAIGYAVDENNRYTVYLDSGTRVHMNERIFTRSYRNLNLPRR